MVGTRRQVEPTVGGVIVSFAQQTEGRGNAMLNLSVSGLASVVDTSAVGWASLILRIPETILNG